MNEDKVIEGILVGALIQGLSPTEEVELRALFSQEELETIAANSEKMETEAQGKFPNNLVIAKIADRIRKLYLED